MKPLSIATLGVAFLLSAGFKTYTRLSPQTISAIGPDSLKTVGEWSPFFSINMDEIWRPMGLKGANYYSMGQRQEGKSYFQRSDFKSKYYQAWFGTYVIDATNDLFGFPNEQINTHTSTITEKILNIGLLDQDAWLYGMTDPNALASTAIIKSGKYVVLPDSIYLEGVKLPVFEASYSSHSDLTDNIQGLAVKIGMPEKSYWQDELQAYHSVRLNGLFLYWYNAKDKTLKVIYGTGTEYSTKSGQTFNTYPQLRDEMLTMAKSLTYR